MGMITREQWAIMETVVDEVWDLEEKKFLDYRPKLYNVQNSTKSQENHLGIGAVTAMKPWTGTVDYQDFEQGYSKGYRHAKYSSGMQLEEEIVRFEEFNKIQQRVQKLNYAVNKTYQKHAVSTLNNAFSASFKGPDNVALCSASHPLSPVNSATVQNNVGSYTLTPANLDTVFQKMTEFTDDQGDPVGVTPNLIIVGNKNRVAAKKIIGSALEPFTAENDTNVWNDDMQYLYLPLITGNTWFLADKQRMMMFMNWFDARKAKIESEEVFDSEVMKFKVVAMFSYGWDNWDWIYGNLH